MIVQVIQTNNTSRQNNGYKSLTSEEEILKIKKDTDTIKKEELKEGEGYYFRVQTRYGCSKYNSILISKEQILDGKFQSFRKFLTKEKFLRRNLLSSPLYIKDEENFLRVKDIIEVSSPVQNDDSSYLLFFTKRLIFAIRFSG